MRLAAVRLLALTLVGLLAVPLLLPVGRSLAAGTLDQSQTNQNSSGANGALPIEFGQSFTAGRTGVVDQVSLAVGRGAVAVGNLIVQIQTVDGSGLPTGTVLGSAVVPTSSLPVKTSPPVPFTMFTLTPSAPVVAGTQYAIVYFSDGVDVGTYLEMPGTYSGGMGLDKNPGWFGGPNFDRPFQTFVTQAAVSVGGGFVAEGNSGARNLAFPVFTTLAVGVDVTASYALADGSATGGPACTPGVDYINTGGTATVTAGSTVGSIAVPVCGDADFEPDEGLTVTLSAPTNAVLGTNQALGTIQNDDATPTPTSTATPTQTPIPQPTFAPGATPGAAPVRVSAQRAGTNRMLVTIAASGPIERVAWPTVANVVVETADGTPITTGSLAPPQGSTTAVFYVRRTGGGAATLPLTVTGAFPTWQTFVGGGPSAW